jgi:mRNA-degrading endonuclease RelE of RelBE toxin-antitoxin system
MEFIESPTFTRLVRQMLTDREYSMLQSFLAAHPKVGDVIQGTAGLRKIRWGSGEQGRGKRGGVRVIYYIVKPHLIYVLYIYRKSSRDEMTKELILMLRRHILEVSHE